MVTKRRLLVIAGMLVLTLGGYRMWWCPRTNFVPNFLTDLEAGSFRFATAVSRYGAPTIDVTSTPSDVATAIAAFDPVLAESVSRRTEGRLRGVVWDCRCGWRSWGAVLAILPPSGEFPVAEAGRPLVRAVRPLV